MEKILSQCVKCHHAKWVGEDCKHPAKTFKATYYKEFPIVQMIRLRIKEYDYYRKNYIRCCDVCKELFKPRSSKNKYCSVSCAGLNREQRKAMSSPAFDVEPKQEIRKRN